MEIILASGSFRGQFGDHFRVGNDFGVRVISGAVQFFCHDNEMIAFHSRGILNCTTFNER